VSGTQIATARRFGCRGHSHEHTFIESI
jgi:hypothetical protein